MVLTTTQFYFLAKNVFDRREIPASHQIYKMLLEKTKCKNRHAKTQRRYHNVS